MVLIFGDSDYEPIIITTAIKHNWIIETWFWNMGMKLLSSFKQAT